MGKKMVFYTDGQTFHNGNYQGEQSSSILVANHAGTTIYEEQIGNKTNNEAELTAILRCLQLYPQKRVKIYSDSQLAVNLSNGLYGTKIPHLAILVAQIKEQGNFEIKWVPREENLAGRVFDKRLGKY